MSGPLIALVTVLYAATSVAFLVEGKPGFALMFAGYVIARLGILWASQ